jgi:hypothetical protein
VADETTSYEPEEDQDQRLRAPAPSRDDTWRSLPQTSEGQSFPDSGGEQKRRPSRSWRRTAVTLVLFVVVLWLRSLDFGSGTNHESGEALPPEPPAAILNAGPEVMAYLTQIETICRAHDRMIAMHPGETPLDKIVRSETRVTSQIAALPAPPGATEMRRAMLNARRGVDGIAIRTYRLMAKRSDPEATLKQLDPVIEKRVDHMYGTFASFGVYCDIASAPGT